MDTEKQVTEQANPAETLLKTLVENIPGFPTKDPEAPDQNKQKFHIIAQNPLPGDSWYDHFLNMKTTIIKRVDDQTYLIYQNSKADSGHFNWNKKSILSSLSYPSVEVEKLAKRESHDHETLQPEEPDIRRAIWNALNYSNLHDEIQNAKEGKKAYNLTCPLEEWFKWLQLIEQSQFSQHSLIQSFLAHQKKLFNQAREALIDFLNDYRQCHDKYVLKTTYDTHTSLHHALSTLDEAVQKEVLESRRKNDTRIDNLAQEILAKIRPFQI